MATKSGWSPTTRTSFVKSSAFNILNNPKLRAQFRQAPESVLAKVIEDIPRAVPKAEKEDVKEEIKKEVFDADYVLPGFNIDEAKEMLYTSLSIPRANFHIFTWLNVVLFGVGIALFVLAAVYGLVRNEAQFSIAFGAGGVASLLPLLITNPLKRISNAASDQSQLRTIIFGYWTQLANLRTQMKHLKTTPGLQTVKDVNAELQKAMEHATELLQKNVEAEIKETNPDTDKDMEDLKKRVEELEKKLKEQSG